MKLALVLFVIGSAAAGVITPPPEEVPIQSNPLSSFRMNSV